MDNNKINGISSIISLNINCSHPITPAKDLPFKDRISIVEEAVKAAVPDLPDVFAIQEAWSSKIEEVEKQFPDYHVIAPKNYCTKKHTRSMIPLLLLKKTVFIDITPLDLGDGKTMAGRYVYVLATTVAGEIWHIMDMHLPQTINHGKRDDDDEYVRLRKKGQQYLWNELKKEAKAHAGDYFLLLGDLQSSSRSKKIKSLLQLGFKECAGATFPTVQEGFFPAGASIDHIIFSEKAYDEIRPSRFALDGGSCLTSAPSLTGYVTDHSMLVVTA